MRRKIAHARQASVGIVLAGTFVLTSCFDGDSTGGDLSSTPTPVTAITAVESPQTLESYLKAGIRARTTTVPLMPREATTDTASGGSSAPPAYSGTNLQEAGVDEADRVKSDGQWLYALKRPVCCDIASAELRILSLNNGPVPDATEESSLALPAGIGGDGLYLYSNNRNTQLDRLAVVGNSRNTSSDWYSPWMWQNGGVDVTVVDITDRANPTPGTRLHINGQMVSSRRVGDTLYLISRFVPVIPGYVTYPATEEAQSENERLLEEISLTELLPNWQVDGADKGDLFDPRACYLLPVSKEDYSPDLVTITAIDLHNPTATPKSVCLLGPTETVYASTEAIYLATTRYHYEPWSGGISVPTGEFPTTTITTADAPLTVQPMVIYPDMTETDLHKFALTPEGPVLRGSASVPGHLGWHQDKKSFRLGEHEGVLRVLTSSGLWEGDQIRLTTLAEQDGALKELAHLPNDKQERTAPIGKPGEHVYAVRFLGNRGFVVTFRTIDPLYVLDLTDPADPFIAGALEIPGYSDYLHPVSETRLLGIGKEAIAADGGGDGRGAWYQGVKLGLFDISNPALPQEIQSVVIGKRGTEAGILQDHHALAWLPADPAAGRSMARLALPVDLHETATDYTTSDPWSWYDWTHRGLYLFDIDPLATSNAITARGTLVVDTDNTVGPWDPVDEDRAIIAKDAVHYLSGNEVWSASWGSEASLVGPQ